MSYQINPDGTIINLVTGQAVPKDISSPAYNNYRYWIAHKINLTTPLDTVIADAEIIEEVKEEEIPVKKGK